MKPGCMARTRIPRCSHTGSTNWANQDAAEVRRASVRLRRLQRAAARVAGAARLGAACASRKPLWHRRDGRVHSASEGFRTAHPRVPARGRRQRDVHDRARRRLHRVAPARAACRRAPARPRVGGRRHAAPARCTCPSIAAANEVTFIPPVTMVRSLGVATQRARLLAVTLDSERVIAEYTFNHSPWGQT